MAAAINGKRSSRPMTRDIAKYPRTNYPVPKKRFDKEIRAFADEALAQSKSRKAVDRRPLAWRIQRRDHAYAGVSAGRRSARRPHSRREEYALENRDERRWHLQTSATSCAKIYFDQCRCEARHGHDRLLPDRGTLEPHLVCAHLSASASTTCAITTAPGRNGATKSARRLKRARDS